MRTLWPWLVAGALALMFVGACALPSNDEFASGSPDAGPTDRVLDGDSASDASTTPETSLPNIDAGGDAEPSLPLINLLDANRSGFEQGSCEGSGAFQAKLTGATPGHDSTYSCSVCAVPKDAFLWSLDDFFDRDVKRGEEYRATVALRRPVGSTDALQVGVSLRMWKDGEQVVERFSDLVTLTDDWQIASATLPIAQDGDDLDIYVFSKPTADNTCFLVDDLVVWKSK